ncbi:uncharacterized protein N7459_009300 [Penicillium hispanicum]|uniref:uncharacterized protein n=1 Tax=Penicillium hispanicum TaxID=1080232 RepID=UPI0025401B5A|nr:uncharacterized protein N7459_009300 [Penicillium hispanicum]KAJ5569870.1 hypothetical protein N7459_009300 [Penicillium hispanicum]
MAPREFVDIFIRRIPPYDQPTLNLIFAEQYPVFMDRVQKVLRGLRSERREFLDHVKELRNSDEFKAAKKAYQEQKRAEARARRAKGEPSERDYNKLLESRAYEKKRKFDDLYGVTRSENELQHTHALREAWGEWAVALVERCLHSLKLNIPISTNNYVPTLSMLQYATGVLKEAGKLDEETESRVEKPRGRVHQRYAHNQYAHNADPAWAEKFLVDKPEGMDVEYPYQPWPDLSPHEGLSVTEQKNWITYQHYLAKHAMLNYQKKDEWTHRQVSTRQKYELVLVAKWLYFFHKGWVLGNCTKPTTAMVGLARRVLAQEGRLDKKMEAGLEWTLKEICSEKKRSFKEEVEYWAPRTSTAKKQLDDARQLGDNELIQRRWGEYAVSLVNKYLAYYSSNKKPGIREKPTTEMVDHARAVLIAEGKHDEVVEGHLKHLEAEVLQRPSTQA